LNEVDVSGVAPLTGATNTASGGAGHQTMSMRADVVTDGGYPDKVLSNAPERIGQFYAVPKVVE
jgi:aspartyl-tRNA(Asn)/glutamyl-tRNA(Gln) amidotransferase subunit C